MKTIYLIIFMLSTYNLSKGQAIAELPVVFDETRIELSLQYMKERYGIIKNHPSIEPKIIVVHWTGFKDLEASYGAMRDPVLAEGRKDIKKGGELNVSAHYLVDRTGEIYRMMPDTLFARHVIGLNYYAIGIENVGDGMIPLTEAQLKANIQLIKMLLSTFDIQYVIGHHEYQSFIGTPLWLEKDSAYITEKADPGIEFMEKIRKGLHGHRIMNPPRKMD